MGDHKVTVEAACTYDVLIVKSSLQSDSGVFFSYSLFSCSSHWRQTTINLDPFSKVRARASEWVSECAFVCVCSTWWCSCVSGWLRREDSECESDHSNLCRGPWRAISQAGPVESGYELRWSACGTQTLLCVQCSWSTSHQHLLLIYVYWILSTVTAATH